MPKSLFDHKRLVPQMISRSFVSIRPKWPPEYVVVVTARLKRWLICAQCVLFTWNWFFVWVWIKLKSKLYSSV